MEEPLGILILSGLIILFLVRLISGYYKYRRVEKYGILILARVTDIKRESRLVTQTGGVASTFSRWKYENYLYAQGQDLQTQRTYTFRVKVPDFFAFKVGEEIFFKMNPENPNEYRISSQ
ncbi:MAG TPA: hypothetical protein VFA09_27065 [Ktedonobacteraceae bacterium]|nr:hypothetical protein [Ktedonobacteraceae bacterium]